MRYIIPLLLICVSGCICRHSFESEEQENINPADFLQKAVIGPQDDGTYIVATKQLIDPAGKSIFFEGRPTGIAITPDQKILAVKNKKDIVFIDVASQNVIQTLPLPQCGNSFCGIHWSPDGKTVWTTSATRFLLAAAADANGCFNWTEKIEMLGPAGNKNSAPGDNSAPRRNKKTIPDGNDNSAPGGFAIDSARGLIYVAMSRNNSVGIIDLASKKLTAQIPVGIAPYDVLICGNKAYVTNWAGRRPLKNDLTGPTSTSKAVVNASGIVATGTVSVIDLDSQKVIREINVELHPSGMACSPDSSRLYVANANSDTISVIDTASDTVTARWIAKPMATLPFGSAPNALAVSRDGSRLYAALGGNNCIAVFDTASGKVIGLIPTGWYPGSVCLAQNDSLLCVGNVKGIGSPGNDSHKQIGSISLIPAPDAPTLEKYTICAASNMNLPEINRVMNLKNVRSRRTPVPARPGERSVFKHVVYIIKENRTYDQVFGDLPQGKGDPSLCHFGRDVTPNHHALAEEFVLLDNFYCNGVCSADGHQWTDEGCVTDYIEKSFGGWTRSYPFDGGDAMAYASSGFIWDRALSAGLTFRNYGEMVKAKIEPAHSKWSDVYKDYLDKTEHIKIRGFASVRGLEPYTCPNYIGFPQHMQDVYRARRFIDEFDRCQKEGKWQNFTIMLLPNDHTSGTVPGLPTPRASVADNDLALGRIVEAISHSRFWPETVIFVVEDDPQNGLDHIDGHRTVALCISPYTKRKYVDSTSYNQSSMLRTIELILGLAPMNQFDMAANPMLSCFTASPDLAPYSAKPNNIRLDELNPPLSALKGKQRYYAAKSMRLPLDDVDKADEDTLNRILWHSVKGYDVPYPKLTR